MSYTATKQTSKHSRVIGLCLAMLGAALMSLDPVFIRFAGVSGVDTAFLFGLFSAISMPILLKINDPRGIKKAVTESGWPLLLMAVLMLGSASGLVFSIKTTSIANTFIILSATPAIAALFSWILLKEKTQQATLIAISLVMLGIVIVVSGSFTSGNWLGDLFALFSVICLAMMLTLLRKFQNVSRLASVALGGALLALVMFFFANPASFSLQTWLIMATMGLLSAPIGRVLSMVSTRYISAAEVSMIMMLETVLAPLWAYLFFSEIPVSNTIIGGILIFITLSIYTLFTIQSDKE